MPETPSPLFPPASAPEPESTPAANPRRRMSLRRRVVLMMELLFLLLLVGALLAISSQKVQFEKVISSSMEPTLMVGDIILSDAGAQPHRYDIICLNSPEDIKEKLVKRIIGEGGDHIRIRDGIISVNGKEEYSDKIKENTIEWKDIDVDVPYDAFFVLGDNRNNSHDSLNFGPVPFDHIRGVVWAICWPPTQWGHPARLH